MKWLVDRLFTWEQFGMNVIASVGCAVLSPWSDLSFWADMCITFILLYVVEALIHIITARYNSWKNNRKAG